MFVSSCTVVKKHSILDSCFSFTGATRVMYS